MRIVLLLSCLLALAACGGGGEEEPAASRPAAPTISGTTLDGDELSLEQLRGKPVMINAWASW